MLEVPLNTLSEKDKGTYKELLYLRGEELELLEQLISKTNNDGIALFPKENETIHSLIQKGYISKNTIYNGPGFSFFILPKSQTLLNSLRFYCQNHNKKISWIEQLKRNFQ